MLIPCVKQRNSHWRVQSFAGHPQPIKNDIGVISPFPGKFDENNISITPNILANSTQNPVESEPTRDVASKIMDQQTEIVNKGLPPPMPLPENLLPAVRSDGMLAHPLHGPISDAQSTQCPTTSGDALNQQEHLTIEGGTISISSVYSQGWVLLPNLYKSFFDRTLNKNKRLEVFYSGNICHLSSQLQ